MFCSTSTGTASALSSGVAIMSQGVKLRNTSGFYLRFHGKASAEIAWHCKHYKGRGIKKAYRYMGEFAKEYTSQKQTRGHLQGLHPSSLGPDFATFENIQAGFRAAHTQQVSMADLIVLSCVGVEIAAGPLFSRTGRCYR